MRKVQRSTKGGAARVAVFILAGVALSAGSAFFGGTEVSANHPVFVEGNCDSPVPDTTLITIAGTCGDFDGDGRIGTAEDTDGADRIFGTIRAALGPGTGAAAGTGINHNGRIVIVASGRFREKLFIGNDGIVAGEGVPNPGNVTIEADPPPRGREVIIADPPSGQTSTCIQVAYNGDEEIGYHVVTLRGLVIRNFLNDITASLNSRVHIDRCRLETNLGYGIRATDDSRVVITNTQVDSTGFRVGGLSETPSPGTGISVEGTAQARIGFTNVSHSAAAGINNATGSAANVVLYGVTVFFNSPDIAGAGVVVAPDPNNSQ